MNNRDDLIKILLMRINRFRNQILMKAPKLIINTEIRLINDVCQELLAL